MNKNLLFIDTEASGLPKNWSVPYSVKNNWPHAVQVSWIVYDDNRNELKRENHYICNDDFNIEPSAIQIHRITNDFLKANGKSRDEVLRLLAADLLQYQPLVIGHFIKFDYYVLSADFYRSGMENPLSSLPVFCTMVASKYLAHNPMPRQMRLDELYRALFHREQENPHNALSDAAATAECFFELCNQGEITAKLIDDQNVDADKWRDPVRKPEGCALPMLMLVLLGILIFYLL